MVNKIYKINETQNIEIYAEVLSLFEQLKK
jgi:hypothetical protein